MLAAWLVLCVVCCLVSGVCRLALVVCRVCRLQLCVSVGVCLACFVVDSCLL